MIERRTCPLAKICPRAKGSTTSPSDLFSRRDWIKHFVVGTAASAGLGRIPVLAEIAPTTNPNSIIRVNLNDYPALQNDFGSLQLILFGDPSSGTTVENGIITITRAPGNIFHAVSASCTHEGIITDRYRGGDDNTIQCYGHGSVFDIQGRVIFPFEEGQADLPYYNSELVDPSTLLIHIPHLNLAVGPIVTASVNGTNKRFCLTFRVNANARYRVRFTPNFGAPSTIVPFATIATGPATQTQLQIPSEAITNPSRNIWVDATSERGFYSIELVITQNILFPP
jgi:nitrite reductase/ring-hydroxylating ferredoxin subunit